MIVILGLVVLVAALIAGVTGVLANGGHAHAVTHFAVFGYHVTGSTGTLFLYGIVVGALALAGLSVLLAGARRTSRRGRDARRGLAQSRRETAAVSADRDDLRGQRDTARAYSASALGDDGIVPNGIVPNGTAQNGTAQNGTAPNGTAQNGTAPNGTDPGSRGPSRFARLFARRPASPQTDPQTDALASEVPAAQPERPADQAVTVPAGASAPAE
jgi:hypothetical protein